MLRIHRSRIRLSYPNPNLNQKDKEISAPGPVDRGNCLFLLTSPFSCLLLSLSGRTGHTEVVRVVWEPEKTSFSKLLKVFWESHNPTQELTACALFSEKGQIKVQVNRALTGISSPEEAARDFAAAMEMRRATTRSDPNRSANLHYTQEQLEQALASKDDYQKLIPSSERREQAGYTYTQEQLEQALASKDDYQKVLIEGGFGEITTEIAESQEFYYAEDYHQQYLSKNPGGYCGLSGTGVSCPIGLKK
ncbi:mitochondrial peptide methionine sulfoxide reductase [Salvelinus sp. IW2-2015]|uniref:mitochondrial peptide methionine sulfoxide reductase n=1 Tax=Salvelinus sp. IW2-2015 TaxID=2691554 RepID=UPI0038D44264